VQRASAVARHGYTLGTAILFATSSSFTNTIGQVKRREQVMDSSDDVTEVNEINQSGRG
jgi:hypothetical protein